MSRKDKIIKLIKREAAKEQCDADECAYPADIYGFKEHVNRIADLHKLLRHVENLMKG